MWMEGKGRRKERNDGEWRERGRERGLLEKCLSFERGSRRGREGCERKLERRRKSMKERIEIMVMK